MAASSHVQGVGRSPSAACADVRRRTNDSEINRGIDVGSIQCQAMFLEGGLDDPECLRPDAVQLGKLLTRSTCKLSQRRITSSIQCSRSRCADLRECVKGWRHTRRL